jgi:hypothetical protein
VQEFMSELEDLLKSNSREAREIKAAMAKPPASKPKLTK